MKKYLSAVASSFQLARRPDPSLTYTGERDPRIRAVLHEQTRWESMPCRREPVTWDLISSIASKKTTSDLDSLEAVMVDWCTVGMYAGFRLSEWAQESTSFHRSHGVSRNVDGSARAFLLSDFSFRDAEHRLIPWSSGDDHSSVSFATIRWRFQKNGVNGETLHYARHDDDTRCPVRALLRICSRTARLGIPPESPIAAFRLGKVTQYISDLHIDKVLRSAAQTLYGLTSKTDIARFSSHSIRVGACVALHEAGMDETFIQHRLRWKSNTWKMYLRNTFGLASHHSRAFLPGTTNSPPTVPEALLDSSI